MSDPRANPDYASDQLSRTLRAAEQHPDPAVRQRAREKSERWERVLRGMLDGNLNVGSRTPIQGTPPWVTLEVVHGGFATGNFAAGGPILPHEQALLERVEHKAAERQSLNTYFLSDAGQTELHELLKTGCYRIGVPEEGALLVVAWLLSHGQAERAEELLEEIVPFFDRLRFYPTPDPLSQLPSPLVHRRTVAETAKAVRATRTQTDVLRMNESLTIWLPLYDRTVAVFLETVEGEAPRFTREADGELSRGASGQPTVEGGFPCQVYPKGWNARARAVLKDYKKLRRTHQLCKKPDHPKENFARLREYLSRCIDNPKSLSGRDVNAIRRILAAAAWSNGAIGSPEHQHLRSHQAAVGQRPLHAKFRQILAHRLSAFSGESGLESLAPIELPVTEAEQSQFQIERGAHLPTYLCRKAEQCLLAPVETLVERGVIPSGEVLAQVLPQLTSQIQAASIADRELRRLYGAIYSAFRRRRSLLLLNFEHQVRFGELPWVAAMDAQRGDGLDAKEQARQAFEQLAVLAVTAFPQAIFPNTLLQEFRSLASAAGLTLPFVDELAADIFMGAFTEKFLVASQIAARMLRGSLYQRYYGLPYDRVLALDDVPRSAQGAKISKGFAQLCEQLAGAESGQGWSVARNGTIIEQSQILTTQNLAPIFDALALHVALRARLKELGEKTFIWICRQQLMKVTDWRTQLQRIKNGAYAWRQMIFYLSFLDKGELDTFLEACRNQIAKLPQIAQNRFTPAFDGLLLVARGGSFGESGIGPAGERRFLGWTTEQHWLRGAEIEGS